MKSRDSSPPAAFQRVPFAQATQVQLASAFVYAAKRLKLHFPPLEWPVWSGAFAHEQPTLLVNGDDAYLAEEELSRLVQCLAASRELPVLNPPVYGIAARQLALERIALLRQAMRAMKELQENPRACGPFVYELFTTLIKSNALAQRVYAATREAGPRRLKIPKPKALKTLLRQLNDCRRAAGLPVSREKASDPAVPLGEATAENAPAPTGRPNPSNRRTFADIAEHHRRSNGKTRFTTRELCQAMHIGGSSLSQARENPGLLSLDAVLALAEAMEERPSQVVSDLLAEVKRKRRFPEQPGPK